MESHGILLFFVFLLHMIEHHGVYARCSGFCPAANNTPNTGGISHVYIKDNQFLHLTCCTPAYDVITWEKYNSTSNTWLAFPWFEPCPHCPGVPSREICDAGQAYVVRSTRKWDAGVYRCVVTGDESVTSRRFSVEYIQCEDIQGQVVIVEKPPPVVKIEQHKNVTLTCRGYFGCRGSAEENRSAEWSYVDPDGTERLLSNQTQDQHYHLTHGHSDDGVVVESVVEISGVLTSDYTTVFRCRLVSGTNEQKNFTVYLQAPDKDVFWNLKIIIIASICVAIIVGFVVAMVIGCCLHYPQIVYQYRRRYDQLPKRDPRFEHDVTILCSEENEEFVKEDIEPKLKEFQYSVSTENTNRQQVGQKSDAIERSFCTVVIFSQSELYDNLFSSLFNVTATYRGLNMIVIEREPIPQEFWEKTKNQFDTQYREGETVRNIPKILKTVRWPGTNCKNKRKINNFWAEIRAWLPVPLETKRNVDCTSESRSSTRPLLSSGAYCAGAIDVTTNDDDVFVPNGSGDAQVAQNTAEAAIQTASIPVLFFYDETSTSLTPSVEKDGSKTREGNRPSTGSNKSDGVVKGDIDKSDNRPDRLNLINRKVKKISEDSGYAKSPETLDSDVIVQIEPV